MWFRVETAYIIFIHEGDKVIMDNKSRFTFTVNDTQLALQLINSFLTTHKYTPQNTDGATWYLFNDPILTGKSGFEFSINGNEVEILAYIGTYKKPKPLDNGFVAAVAKQATLNKLQPLFNELHKLSGVGAPVQNTVDAQPVSAVQNTAPTQATPAQPTMAQSYTPANFEEQAKVGKNKFAIIAFVCSLISLVCSCFGVAFGVIIQILIYYFAALGLKSEKKGLAIAAIVINSCALVITILMIILTVLLG